MTIHKKTVEARWYLGCNEAILLIDFVELQPYVPLSVGNNEAEANSEWIPGGHTSGGVPEAVVYNVPNDPNVIDIITVRLERK